MFSRHSEKKPSENSTFKITFSVRNLDINDVIGSPQYLT